MDWSQRSKLITNWLRQANSFWFTLYTTITVFLLYTCIYALRKTFSVATFDNQSFLNISYKVWLVTSQVIGYALSKFVGIKMISELKSTERAKGILWMCSIAAISWLFFAITPAPYNIVFLLTNGFPLGLIWGMIFAYLEGRKTTEVLGAGLSISFIFSSGFAKSTGAYIMRDWGTDERWMPFVAACLFFIPILMFLWFLEQVPEPSFEDEQLRTKRLPMKSRERKDFVSTFWPGHLLFILAYMLLTAFRDLRDNFSAEIWKTLGYAHSPEIFTKTEIPVSLAVLIIMGSVMFIKSNKMALMVNHTIIISGMLLIGIATWLFQSTIIGAEFWMILVGLGLYLGYVPFNCIFFDRLIAAFRYTGTVGFIIYLSDSFGYFGSITVLFAKEFGFSGISWLNFFIQSGYYIAFMGTFLILGSMLYFYFKHKQRMVHILSESKTLSVATATD